MPVRLDNQMEPIPGYRLLERLGSGGFGEVWKAEAPGGLLKAIKFVHGNLETANKEDGVAAAQELKALSRVKTVRHPFILSLERFDIVDGQLIIVMELADRNLWDRFKECRGQGLPGIPRDELLGYLEEAAEALDLMNLQYQLQHLDIKPQNLFLVHNHIKVADFGLVKDLEGMKATVTGGVTPLYAAPETFDGWVSRFSDQYSLAIVFQEMLTGQRPFNGTNARQLILQHLTVMPDLSSLPLGDQAFIGRALAKTPDERFPTCEDLVRALRGHTATAAGTAAVPASPPATLPAGSALARPDTDRTSHRTNEELVVSRGAPLTPRVNLLKSPFGRAGGHETAGPAQLPGVLGEKPGEGVLFPVLVIGAGELGLHVLQRLREGLFQRFGSTSALPNLRLLFLDTDPDVLRRCPERAPGSSVAAAESLIFRLNRPSHYLKPRDGKLACDNWLDPKLLYRMPRNQTSAGLRALGRLALVDHFPTLVQRLREDLRAIADPMALAGAGEHTELSVRSGQPRVYIVCGLGGGTGSGMFLDLAYVARQQLRQQGVARPEVIGVFLLPPADAPPAGRLGVANAYAALTELAHFSAADATFQARYAGKDGTIEDAGPPFDRCLLLPLPAAAEEGACPPAAGLAGGWLLRELTTPLGRAAARCRAAATPAGPGPHCQTAGLYRLVWPRQALARQAARELSLRLVQQWTARDAEPIQQEVLSWVAEQWPKRKLAPEYLIDALETACEQSLGESPESAWELITGRLGRRGASGPQVEQTQAAQALQQLIGLLGKPGDEAQGLTNGTLVQTLDRAARDLVVTSEQKLAEMAVSLVEQPPYRLAGAEEAIRQARAALEQLVQVKQEEWARSNAHATELYNHLTSAVQTLQTNPAAARRRTNFFLDLIEAFRLFPEVRFRSLVLQGLVTVYRHMLSNCPEYLRELGFCRVRLGELQKAIEARPVAVAETDLGPVHHLLPAGCHNLTEAAAAIAKTIAAPELLDFDHAIQGQVRRQFKALVHVCMTAANLLKDLEKLLLEQAETFLQARLGKSNAVETLLEPREFGADAAQVVRLAFAGAEPKLPAGVGGTEWGLALVPGDTSADQLQALVHRCLPQIEVLPAPAGDDVVFYRERTGLTLAHLPQLGPQARDAYRQVIDRDHCTPHSRVDIADWRAPE